MTSNHKEHLFFVLLILLALAWLILLVISNKLSSHKTINQKKPTSISSPNPNQSPSGSKLIQEHYIVIVKNTNNPTRTIEALEKKYNLKATTKYQYIFQGFAAKIPQDKLNQLKKDPAVASVSEEWETQILTRNSSIDSALAAPPPRRAPNTGVTRIGADLAHRAGIKGQGITVAVVDSGIDGSHEDLKDSVVGSVDCVWNDSSKHWHGTSVAGVIAARDNGLGMLGVAPEVKLVDVRVADSRGWATDSALLCGLDWILKNKEKFQIRVLNQSIAGFRKDQTEPDHDCGQIDKDPSHIAACQIVDAGIIYIAGAGNDGKSDEDGTLTPIDFCDAVISASSLGDSDGIPGGLGPPTYSYNVPDDTFDRLSNYGPNVQIGAPGEEIYSTYTNNEYRYKSGTSLAAPHVGGAVALLLQQKPNLDWSEVLDVLYQSGEALNQGHTDRDGNHTEPVIRIDKALGL